jgi:anti-sigma B factor antagonist
MGQGVPNDIPFERVGRMTTIIERSGPRSFRLSGNIDASNAANVADALEPYFQEEGDVTIDLSELEFIDSVGLGVLVTATKGLRGQGKLILENPQHTVARAIELAGLMSISNLEVREVEPQPAFIEEPPPPPVADPATE